jgi:hypothetical protein
MPDVNYNMDELFKKAAEEYPLNTDSSDWNKVYKALSPQNVPLEDTAKKNRSRRLLWLLLLLPLIAVIYKYSFNYTRGSRQESISKKYNQDEAKQKNIEEEIAGRKKSEVTLSGSNNTTTTSKKLIDNTQKKNPGPSSVRHISDEQNVSAQPVNIYKKNDNITDPTNSSNYKISASNTAPHTKADKKNQISDNNNNQTLDNNKTSTVIGNPDLNKEAIIKPGIIKPETQSETNNSENKKLTAADSLANHSINKASKKKSKEHHLYAGIIGGGDISTIKFQKIIKTGFIAGIITGYKLNKKWSIESGFYIDKKSYYTDGKYFSTKKVYIPTYTKIEDIDGDCHMIELPVNVKYNFKSDKKITWFALIGTSSYLMKKEEYEYRYKSYGELKEKQLSYKNSSKNWASIINVSAGYSRNIGRNGTLRIEPYIKIPFKGVGIGSLPITSSGVYFGFTKNLF